MSHRSGIEVTEDIKNEMAKARKGDVRVLQVPCISLYCIYSITTRGFYFIKTIFTADLIGILLNKTAGSIRMRVRV